MPSISFVASTEPVSLMSLYKPILLLLVAGGWAKAVGFFDKDLADQFLKRRSWNGIQIAAGVLAFFLWLMIPWFWLGLLLAMVILGSGLGGYIIYRNSKVPAGERWHFDDLWKARIDDAGHRRAQQRASVRLMTTKGVPIDVPTGQGKAVEAHALFEHLMEFALPRGADRFELVADQSKTALAVRVDGVSYPQHAVEPAMAIGLIEYLKEHAGLEVADHRTRQRGGLNVTSEVYGRHELMVATAGTTRGLTMIVEIDRQQASLMTLDKIGLLESQQKQLAGVLDETRHVVIVACPSHHGMTSTMSSIVNRHDAYTQSVMSLEEEVEVELEGVMHEVIEPGSDAETIERRISAMLRSDPSVIMLSRLSDASHARLIADAASDVRFYLGLRQDDTFAALRVWLKAVGDDELAARNLGAIVAQRLVRRLCPTCRIAYKPDPAVLKKLNMPAERVPQMYKHSGQVLIGKDRTEPCPKCLGMGYRGRIGVFETMVLNDEARQVLATGQIDQFRALLRRHKMLYLQESALLKVVEGLTSITEVTRALGGDK
ncbi:MAG: hypothetical protein CMJ18_02835 [Phycisphaeraceae bacterium]|nr:hypothetical protein [Phycisphaeraceae bacterium]